MTESTFEHLAEITATILFIWSAVLLWTTWQVRRMVKELAAEQRAMRRWYRLQSLGKEQNHKWQ